MGEIRMKKGLKQIISLALCLVMAAGIVCDEVSAETKKSGFRYVHVGDSASMEYFMDDYSDKYQHNYKAQDGSEIEPSSSYSVYSRVCDYLKKQGVGDLQAQDLSMTGMRASELRSFWDAEYYKEHEDEVKEFEKGGTFWGYHMDMYLNGKDSYGYGSYETLNKVYTEALTKADLITYDLTMNDFGTYLGKRLLGGGGENFKNDTFANLIEADVSDKMIRKITASAEQLKAALKTLLKDSSLPLETIESYIDIILYSYANFAISFSLNMDYIYQNNRDATVVVIGPYNTVEGMILNLGKVSIDAGVVWGLITEAINTWITSVDTHRNWYKFADMTGGCSTCISVVSENLWDEYKMITEQFYEELGVRDILKSGITKETQIRTNLQVACLQGKNVEVSNLTASLSGDKKAAAFRVMLNPEDSEETAKAVVEKLPKEKSYFFDGDGQYIHTTQADRSAVYINLRIIASFGIGSHPDKTGYNQKEAAFIKAYESNFAADGTRISHVIKLVIPAIRNIFNKVVGACKNLIASFKEKISGQSGNQVSFMQYVAGYSR